MFALPCQYYVDQIRFLFHHLKERSLHVHIFTDHRAPETLAKNIKEQLSDIDVTIGYHETQSDKDGVLEDFFGIMQFDYFIRSNSTFAKAAEILGNFKIVISPEKGTWYDDVLAINITRVLEGKKQTLHKFY